RMNWQGALAGFLLGGVGSGACYLRYPLDHAKQVAPIVSSIVALIVTPIVALLTPAPAVTESHGVLASLGTGRHDEGDKNPFHLIPTSLLGRAGAVAAVAGF